MPRKYFLKDSQVGVVEFVDDHYVHMFFEGMHISKNKVGDPTTILFDIRAFSKIPKVGDKITIHTRIVCAQRKRSTVPRTPSKRKNVITGDYVF